MFVECGSQEKTKKKKTCQHVSAQRGVIERLKMNPFCTHTRAHTHSHPLPAAPASLPPFSWVSEWEIKFFWWESFSCPRSSPPSLSSHPFFNLFAYLWTINLCTEREINSCAVKCSGCCHAHNRWSSPRDWHESHTHSHTYRNTWHHTLTQREHKTGAAYQLVLK